MSVTRLNPPILDSTIPAFCGSTLTVPFIWNTTVSTSDVALIKVKIKDVYAGSNDSILIINSTNFTANDNMSSVTVTVNSTNYQVGSYYKVLLYYVSTSASIGMGSNAAVVKYTKEPSLSIDNFSSNSAIVEASARYTGIYTNEDTTEKVYSYSFLVSPLGEDETQYVVKDALHNGYEDSGGTSTDIIDFNAKLEDGLIYLIQYSVTTINGLTASSPYYFICKAEGIEMEIVKGITAELNYENGYIELTAGNLNSAGGSMISLLDAGTYIIARGSSADDYTVFQDIHKFTVQSKLNTTYSFKDRTIELGATYRYKLFRLNSSGLRNAVNSDYNSSCLTSAVTAKFDNMFLTDGTRQLKIAYNPKVSSIKNTILISKTDTMGSKYPHFFKNGIVGYKELPISGLISRLSDEEELFISLEDEDVPDRTATVSGSLSYEPWYDTNLSDSNITKEREFKLEVLEWLDNGKPKLFRSATEGNYIVRLMNNSLSPNDTLGRMLHTFSGTAYEVADTTVLDMVDNEIIDLEANVVSGDGSLIVSKLLTRTPKVYSSRTVWGITITNAPGAVLTVTSTSTGTAIVQEIKVGSSGSYHLDPSVKIESFNCLPAEDGGNITYYTYDNSTNFSLDSYDYHQSGKQFTIIPIETETFVGSNLTTLLVSGGYKDSSNNEYTIEKILWVLLYDFTSSGGYIVNDSSTGTVISPQTLGSTKVFINSDISSISFKNCTCDYALIVSK